MTTDSRALVQRAAPFPWTIESDRVVASDGFEVCSLGMHYERPDEMAALAVFIAVAANAYWQARKEGQE